VTGRPAVTRRAHGKLFVLGEYAVVEPGNPAILVAVDRHVTVTVSAASGPDVVVTSDLLPGELRLARDGDRLAVRPDAHGQPDGDGHPGGGVPHVVSAIEVVDEYLAARRIPAPAARVAIESGLHDNGTKLGLGSSGAVTVAVVAALTAWCDADLTPEATYRLAMLATARIDVAASGGDLAASVWGGWIAYQAPDRAAVLETARHRGIEAAMREPWPGFALRRLPAPRGVSLQVGWTGEPASTTALVSKLGRRAWRGTRAHARFVAGTTACVRASVRALEGGDRRELLRRVREARRLLAELDDEVGVGIFTSRLTALCDATEAVGGAAKPSGAGGGDCGIALLDAATETDVAQLRARWATSGVVPVPIRVVPTKGEAE
jgi:phosphomevalonate kinase